jgi:hypothetical protein
MTPSMSSEQALSDRLQTLLEGTRALLEKAVREHQDVVYSNSLGAEAMVHLCAGNRDFYARYRPLAR